MLVQDIFIAAMEIIGATTLDELPEPSELQKCLRHCNLMLDSWASRLSLQGTVQQPFTLQAGKVSYTIGLGGDFNTIKPISVPTAFVRDGGGTDYPVEMTEREVYDGLSDKTVSTGRPDTILYDPGTPQQTPQLGTFFCYPIPDAAGPYTLFINQIKYLTEFVNLTDVVNMAPAYNKALVANLAVEIWRPMGRKGPVPPDIRQAATRTMDVLMGINHRIPLMRTDLPGTGPDPTDNPLSGGWI